MTNVALFVAFRADKKSNTESNMTGQPRIFAASSLKPVTKAS